VRLAWSHVGDDAIVLRTGKSGHRREAMIPLYDELREVLAHIPKRSTTILTSAAQALDGQRPFDCCAARQGSRQV